MDGARVSDATTRRLERDLDPEAAGALLRRRIRSGDVPERQVRLAAWLGYPPALAAVDPEAPDAPPWATRKSKACRAVRWSHGLLIRRDLVLLACCFAERVERRTAGPAAIAAARSWAECPCEAHAEAAREAGTKAKMAGDWPAACAARAAWASPGEAAGSAAAWAARARDSSAVAIRSQRKAEAWQALRIAEVLCWGPPS